MTEISLIVTLNNKFTSPHQKVGIIGAQTIDAFDETYYLANHGPLERSVNLVLQGFIHRHTFKNAHSFFLCISIHLRNYICEKKLKLHVHPN